MTKEITKVCGHNISTSYIPNTSKTTWDLNCIGKSTLHRSTRIKGTCKKFHGCLVVLFEFFCLVGLACWWRGVVGLLLFCSLLLFFKSSSSNVLSSSQLRQLLTSVKLLGYCSISKIIHSMLHTNVITHTHTHIYIHRDSMLLKECIRYTCSLCVAFGEEQGGLLLQAFFCSVCLRIFCWFCWGYFCGLVGFVVFVWLVAFFSV